MENILEPFLRKERIKRAKAHIYKNAILCDIGCGFNALFLKEIQNEIKEGIGLDKKVNNYNNSKIRLKKFRLEGKIPFKDNYFTQVSMLAVIEHLKNPKKIIEEINRILKINSTLIITTPLPKVKKILELMSSLRLISPEEIKDHKNYFGKKKISKLLENVGFKIVLYKNFELRLNSLIIAKKVKNLF